ncbi:hypothetical protein KEJ18_00235 [Candidatus Bathyarchaeota archaeon]|nr:hypothetical protein [Candidatus Bathyarchaeota archaeon]
MSERKVEIMYFYSDMHENEKKLTKITKKLGQERKDIHIRLINIDDPVNNELAELYGVDTVPLLVFLTPRGEVAAKKFLPLSAKKVVYQITDQINKGELPNPQVEELKTKILDALNSVTKRSDLTEIVAEQLMDDLTEASGKTELYELINSHISAINHSISDLEEFKRVLQRYYKNQGNFVV